MMFNKFLKDYKNLKYKQRTKKSIQAIGEITK